MLYPLFGFLMAITLLVFIHEMGHYLVAKACGVGVKRFSIGFGAPILSMKDRSGTEWVVGWAPLGGYVVFEDSRMPQEKPVDPAKDFQKKKVWQRFCIALAGPLFNLLFAICAWAALALYGTPEPAPALGAVIPQSWAQQSGFQPHDTVHSIDGVETPTLSEVQFGLLRAWEARKVVSVTVQHAQGDIQTLTVDGTRLPEMLPSSIFMRELGWPAPGPQIPAKIGSVLADAPAALAGLKAGDVVLSVSGQKTPTWSDFVVQVSGQTDQLTEVVVRRDGKELSLSVTPKSVEPGGQARIGVAMDTSLFDIQNSDQFVIIPCSFTQAIVRATQKAMSFSAMSLSAFGKIFTGKVGGEAISGPIGIAQQAGLAAEAGTESFLGFIGFLSLSLFIMNLLPIPALDGGHLLIYAIEAVRRKPLEELLQQKISLVGFALLMLLTVFSIGNDISRLF